MRTPVSQEDSGLIGREQFLGEVAALVAGLQVPVSINSSLLGEAYAPWSRLHNLGHRFGWRKPEDYVETFRKCVELGDDTEDAQP